MLGEKIPLVPTPFHTYLQYAISTHLPNDIHASHF
jgi:hypothetical protein